VTRPPTLVVVKHAGPEALQGIEPLLQEIRTLPGLVEKKPGVFYRNSRAFLHFHEDPTGMYADVRAGEEFARHRVETDQERARFVGLVGSLVGPSVP
jgi:hypothetical protein